MTAFQTTLQHELIIGTVFWAAKRRIEFAIFFNRKHRLYIKAFMSRINDQC